MTNTTRDFAAELKAARIAEDWATHERVWEERRVASVARDEAALADCAEEGAVYAVADWLVSLFPQANVAERRYDALVAELEAIEKSLGRTASGDTYYITDSGIDHENAAAAGAEPTNPFAVGGAEFWDMCYRCACSAAGERCSDYGLNINALIGRDIY